MKNHWATVIRHLFPASEEIIVEAGTIRFTIPEALTDTNEVLKTLKWHLCLGEGTISQDPTHDGKFLVIITTNKPFLPTCPTPVELRIANVLFERYPSG